MTPLLRRIALIAALPAAAAPAAMGQEACSFDYSAFEFSVPHVDLSACPEGIEAGHFCRAGIANDALHVFVFREDATACLAQVLSLEEDAFEIVINGASAD